MTCVSNWITGHVFCVAFVTTPCPVQARVCGGRTGKARQQPLDAATSPHPTCRLTPLTRRAVPDGPCAASICTLVTGSHSAGQRDHPPPVEGTLVPPRVTAGNARCGAVCLREALSRAPGGLAGDQAHETQRQTLPSDGRARRRVSFSGAKVSLETCNEDSATQRKRLRGVIDGRSRGPAAWGG